MFTRDPGDDDESMPDERGYQQESNENMKNTKTRKTKNAGAEAPILTVGNTESAPEVVPILPPSPATRRRWHDAASMMALYDENSAAYAKAMEEIADKREASHTACDLAALANVPGVKGVRFTRAPAVGEFPALTTVHAQLVNGVVISSVAKFGSVAVLDATTRINELLGTPAAPAPVRDPEEVARECKQIAESESVR